jgi:hypothetical protein
MTTRAEVPRLLFAEAIASHNEHRRARGACDARTARLLEAAGGADEITVDGIVVARVRDGRVRYIPPSAREQDEDLSDKEGRAIVARAEQANGETR